MGVDGSFVRDLSYPPFDPDQVIRFPLEFYVGEDLTMRIAQIAPLHERVPPRLYGGTERVVSFLTEELVRQGHEVALFASGDSKTSAQLVPCCEMALRLNPSVRDHLPYHMIMLENVRQRIDQFDILHFHIDLIHSSLVRAIANWTVTTLHGRLDLPDLVPFYQTFRELPLVSISNDQQRYLHNVNWLGTVYHGLPRDLLAFQSRAGGYLAFLGRIAPEKRPDLAIEIAARSGMPLKIAAKVDRADQAYWDTKIRPMVEAHHPDVEFIGEIGERDKESFLGGAAALLFPVDWPEPFGLVMIEAMACGTPVIAFRRGSVPEIVTEGVSGFVVDTIEEAVTAVGRATRLDRAKVRAEFDGRFTAERMARDYVNIYSKLVSKRSRSVQLEMLNQRRQEWYEVRSSPARWLKSDLVGQSHWSASNLDPAKFPRRGQTEKNSV